MTCLLTNHTIHLELLATTYASCSAETDYLPMYNVPALAVVLERALSRKFQVQPQTPPNPALERL